MSSDFDRPKWDVALEALLNEEFSRLQLPLKVEDLQRLAVLHSIRFDDLLDSLMLMCIHGDWRYQTSSGEERQIEEEDYDQLFESGGRTTDEGVAQYDGGWLR